MEIMILVVAAANLATLRLRRKNAKLRAEQEGQVVATLTHSRSDTKTNGKQYSSVQ